MVFANNILNISTNHNFILFKWSPFDFSSQIHSLSVLQFWSISILVPYFNLNFLIFISFKIYVEWFF